MLVHSMVCPSDPTPKYSKTFVSQVIIKFDEVLETEDFQTLDAYANHNNKQSNY